MTINSTALRSACVIFMAMPVSTNIEAGNESVLTDTKTGERSVMNFVETLFGSEGLMLVGKGKAILPDNMLLTSTDIVSINKGSIQIDDGYFQITEDTKICGKDGKKAAFDTFKAGDSISITSLRKGKKALTLKKGLALYQALLNGVTLDKTSYECK